MSILVNKATKLLVQGITGKEGQFHTRACIEYGTQVVAGVTPGKGGQKMDDVPVFNSVGQAVQTTGANASMIFVPPPFAAEAIMEAADAGMPLISDPGDDLVLAASERGIPVIPVPGPSAVVTALAVSGLDSRRFTFLGFLPHKTGDRQRVLESVASEI